MYVVHTTPAGQILHMDKNCVGLRGKAPVARRELWVRLSRRHCEQCFSEPVPVMESLAEVRRVAGALRVVRQHSHVWPGRLPAADVDEVRKAHGRLARARTKHLTATVQAALDVCDALLDGAGLLWVPPPVPPALLGSAAAAMVGVDDHPFFECGHRPRTRADRAAADVASPDALARLWDDWVGIARLDGLSDGNTMRFAPGGRPAVDAALRALVREWFDRASLLCADPNLQVVAVSGTAIAARAAGAQAIEGLTSLAALKVPGAHTFLAVVPSVVAAWLSRVDLDVFELVGPWPGDEDGVAALETLMSLSGGDPYRMPALLPVAVDLVREQSA